MLLLIADLFVSRYKYINLYCSSISSAAPEGWVGHDLTDGEGGSEDYSRSMLTYVKHPSNLIGLVNLVP